MPWGDWQFWAVTAAAAASGWLLIRPLVGLFRRQGGERRRAELTISAGKGDRGEPVS